MVQQQTKHGDEDDKQSEVTDMNTASGIDHEASEESNAALETRWEDQQTGRQNTTYNALSKQQHDAMRKTGNRLSGQGNPKAKASQINTDQNQGKTKANAKTKRETPKTQSAQQPAP